MSNRSNHESAASRHILIVEDEEIIRNTLAEFLTSEGFQVTKTGSVEEGMARAREKDFHLAICDIQLPDDPVPPEARLLRRP